MRKILSVFAASVLALSQFGAALAAPIAYSTVNIPADTPQAVAIALTGAINTQLAPTGTGNVSSAIDIPTVSSAVNQFKLTPGATAVIPVMSAGGASADTNIGIAVNGNGTGGVYLSGSTAANAAVAALHGTANVNQIVLTGTNTGSVPSIAVGGSGADTNRNLSIAGAGTGLVILGQTICTSSGATPQTCNGQRGIATTNSLTTAAATNAAYVINNSSVTASSLVQCTNQGYSGTLVTNGYPIIMSCVPGSGTITVNITNTHAANALSGTVAIGFTVLN